MEVTRAILTAARADQTELPLQTFVDTDGEQKSAFAILIEEALAAGVEEIVVVVAPGCEEQYAQAAERYRNRLRFVAQDQPKGYADALLRAAAHLDDGQAFLHLVGDHLPVSHRGRRCAQDLVEVAQREQCSVSAVQATHEGQLRHFGIVGGRRVAGHDGLYEVDSVLEKPTPTEAEQSTIVPGLRSGHYLCFFGMHVFTPAVVELLKETSASTPHLGPALEQLSRREKYLAREVRGARFDLGQKYGILRAQLGLALAGDECEDVLADVLELVANRPQRTDDR